MNAAEQTRPLLTLHVGQAGVQIGNAIWELLCLEHNITPDGLAKPDCPSNGFFESVFLKSSSGHFMPRSILVDTDPTCINEIRVGPYRDLFSSNQLLSDYTDAGFNYTRGRHGYRNHLLPETMDRIRWLVEKSDSTPAVFLIHGISGGTGSGLAVSCLESLRVEFGLGLQVIDLNVTSGRSGLQNSCELVNQVLYHYEAKEFTNVSLNVTNSAMYNVCRAGLNLGTATYAHLNRMLAMCYSNITAMERFPGSLACNVNSIFSNVLPFRHLKHLVLGCAPFTTADMVGKDRMSAIGLTSAVMEADSQFADIDLRQGRHMAGVLIYRGSAKSADVEQAVASLKVKNSKVEFVDWASPSFKTGLIELPPLAVPSSGIGGAPLSVTLISNHSAVSALFRGHSDGVRKLASQGYFLHNYNGATNDGLAAGHNDTDINTLLREACDHMDDLATVYESGKPPDQLVAPAERQPWPTPDDLKKMERSASDKKKKAKRSLELGKADGKSTEHDLPVGTQYSDETRPRPELTDETPPHTDGPLVKTATASSEMVGAETVTLEKQADYQSDHEGNMTPTSTESRVTFGRGFEHAQSTPGTTEETATGATPTAVKARAGKKANKHKKNSTSCCGGNKKPPPKKGAPVQNPGKADDNNALKQRAQPNRAKRSSSGSCGGGGKKQSTSGRNNRSQSQNHACSELHCYLIDSESLPASDYSGLDYRTSAYACPELWDNDNDKAACTMPNNMHHFSSSTSTHSASDSANDIEDLIQDCIPNSLPLSSTISSVRQIVEKYNRMFASNTNGASPAEASLRSAKWT